MRTRLSANTIRGLRWPFLAVLLLFIAGYSAQAQWTATDAQTAFNSYNNAFYFSTGGNNYDYRNQQGSTSTSGFWVGAEEIELAIDAYNQNPTSGNANIINQLCNGFVAQFTSNWSADTYDDDLMWATIAFVRAYKATGTQTWLTDAENNFATVWNRGYDTTFGGGIWWNVAAANTSSGYKASASNWTFVIAGNLLYQATNNSTYRNEATTIFNWASSTLYDASTGRVHDGINSSGVQDGQYSYNYGMAVGADYFQNDSSDATNTATYLINNLSNGAYNGYNVMPNYGQGGTDGGGFNGITLRWIGYAYMNGSISNSSVLAWAQANVTHAWAQRNSSGLSWNNWQLATPSGTNLYSWDCSDTVVGMLDIPTTLIANGTYVITSVHSGQALDNPKSSTTNGTDIVQWTVNNGTNQQWKVNNLGNNVITLTNVASGQLLDVVGASTANSALLDQWPANGQTNQQWKVISVGSGAYELTSVESGLAVDVTAASTTAGATIDQYTYQGNSWQQWKFTSH